MRVVDRLVTELVAELPSGTTLLVTGDHGMITTDRSVDIDSAPELLDGVEVVAGEARARHVYTEAGATDDVLTTWRRFLGDAAHVVSREQTLDEGWFGPEVTDTIAHRIGDVVAVARDSVTLTRSKNEEFESKMIGHHGAWTSAEQLVPLVVATG